jgi:hypothetical protein
VAKASVHDFIPPPTPSAYEVVETVKQAEPVMKVAAIKVIPMVAGDHQFQGRSKVDRPEPTTLAVKGLILEISNGNGKTGMARALGQDMRRAGFNVKRVTNALPYDKHSSYLLYPQDLRDEASQLAASFNMPLRMVAGDTSNRRVDIRLVLGRDAIGKLALLEGEPIRLASAGP